MTIKSLENDTSIVKSDNLKRFIIRNLGDDRLVARRILLALARGQLSNRSDAEFQKYVFRFPDDVRILTYVAVYLLVTQGHLPDRTSFPKMPILDALYEPVSSWLKACFIQKKIGLPPVNGVEGRAFIDTILDNAVGHLRALRMLGMADFVSTLRSHLDEAWRDSGSTWVLATGFSSHVGHFAYSAMLLTLRSEGWLAGPPITMLRGASRNKFLARQFDAYFSDSIPKDARYVELVSSTKRFRNTDRRWESANDLMSRAASHWLERQPFLVLDEETKASGDAVLAGMGIPPGAPVVTLHVRTSGYNHGIGSMMRLRDAEIATYGEAVRRLTERGFYVVRLGDRTMPQAPAWERFVDYPFSLAKSDWMDAYLTARCHFHIGTSSGMSFIPMLYGRPVVFTNWPTLAQMVCAPSVITLPKVLLDETGAVVPFEVYCTEDREILESSDTALHGLSFRENAPAEIAEAVELMADHYDEAAGRPVFPSGLFAAAQAVTAASPMGTRPQIPPHFFAATYGDCSMR